MERQFDVIVLGAGPCGEAVANELAGSGFTLAVVESRLVDVTDDERDALEVLVFGEPLGATLLESLSCPVATRGLERKGLVEATTDGSRVTVRLVHPLYADVLRSGTPPLRARAVYGRLADALEQTGGHRPDDLSRHKMTVPVASGDLVLMLSWVED